VSGLVSQLLLRSLQREPVLLLAPLQAGVGVAQLEPIFGGTEQLFGGGQETAYFRTCQYRLLMSCSRPTIQTHFSLVPHGGFALASTPGKCTSVMPACNDELMAQEDIFSLQTTGG
jgi:hypothetical protein